jgi:predicted nucleic acid-binding protein
MTTIIVDTGPIVALLSSSDKHHGWTKDLLATIAPPLLTCEAVISEACFLVQHLHRGQDAVLALVEREILKLDFSLKTEHAVVRKLMDKYSSVPMALADACLVRMSELNSKAKILTLDRDFNVYRRNRRQQIPRLMPPE